MTSMQIGHSAVSSELRLARTSSTKVLFNLGEFSPCANCCIIASMSTTPSLVESFVRSPLAPDTTRLGCSTARRSLNDTVNVVGREESKSSLPHKQSKDRRVILAREALRA